LNKFYHGDCKFVLQHDIEPNSIDLIYLDPPFFTGKVQKGVNKWNPSLMEVSYEDSKKFWGESDKIQHMRSNAPLWMTYIAESRPDFASYLYYMMERIQLLHKVLKSTGSIYLHCDWRASHYLKMILDEVFGYQNFRDEIIWHYGGRGAKAKANQFPRNHDVIFYYTKSLKYTFNRQYIQRSYSIEEAKKQGFQQDKNNNWFKTSPRGDYTDESISRLEREDRIYHTSTNSIRIKYPLDFINGKVIEKVLVGDTWNDIPDTMHIGKGFLGYPTQKPLSLLKRIIEASSNKGDIVLDPFCGCGTTIMASNELGRQWIGIDISKDALDITKNRETQMTLEQMDSFSKTERVCRNLEEISKLNPHEFEKWVNEFYKATKPNPDRGVDGITSNGTPIQTKAFEVKYDVLDKLVTAVKLHPNVPKPVKELIIVSQIGFDDSARKAQHQVESEYGIKVTLETPKQLLAI
jgi:DNA modification methylase